MAIGRSGFTISSQAPVEMGFLILRELGLFARIFWLTLSLSSWGNVRRGRHLGLLSPGPSRDESAADASDATRNRHKSR